MKFKKRRCSFKDKILIQKLLRKGNHQDFQLSVRAMKVKNHLSQEVPKGFRLK